MCSEMLRGHESDSFARNADGEWTEHLVTLKDAGYDVVFPKYFYIAAPIGTDDAIVTAFNEALNKVAENAGLQEYASTALVNVTNKTPADTVSYIKEQEEVYKGYLADYIE